MKQITIRGEFIRLDDLLKHAGMVSTGGHAKVVIQGGEVLYNNESCLMRGKKVRVGDIVEFQNQKIEIV